VVSNFLSLLPPLTHHKCFPHYLTCGLSSCDARREFSELYAAPPFLFFFAGGGFWAMCQIPMGLASIVSLSGLAQGFLTQILNDFGLPSQGRLNHFGLAILSPPSLSSVAIRSPQQMFLQRLSPRRPSSLSRSSAVARFRHAIHFSRSPHRPPLLMGFAVVDAR
jgi:hypothetical protein